MPFTLFIGTVKRLKSSGVVVFTFLTAVKHVIKTRPISSHHDQANEVSHKIVLQSNNHMKELQHEFHSGSDGFPCFDFPRLLLQEVFPLE